MADKVPPRHYVEKCQRMGLEMAQIDGSDTVIFTDHAISRCYNRRISPWKALMVVDNFEQRLEDQELGGKTYERYVKTIGSRNVYISLIREPKKIDGHEVQVIVLTSVAWRARGKKKR